MKRLPALLLTLLALLAASPAARCADPTAWTGRVGEWPVELSVAQANPARDLQADLAAAGSLLERHWRQVRREGEGSEIAQVNALAGQRSGRLSRPNYDAILRSLQWKDKTQGSVDLLSGPLQRWAAGGGASPAPDSVLALVRDGGAYFVDLGVLLRTPGMELDLDPLADGLLADRVLDSLRARGHKGLRVRVGGLVRSSPGAGAWENPLERPATFRGLDRLELEGRALAVQAAEDLLDPRSGLPAPAGRVWVLAGSAEEARVWARALAVLGARTGLELLAAQPGVAAAVEAKGVWSATPGFPVPPSTPEKEAGRP